MFDTPPLSTQTNMSQPSIEQLHDIVLPQEPGVFPLAYGWWILIVLISLTLVKSLALIIRRVKFLGVKRLALAKLSHCTSCDDINQLLKQVAIHYFQKSGVAPLQGEQWRLFLSRLLDDTNTTKLTAVMDNLYQVNHHEYATTYHAIAKQWLDNLSVRTISEINHAIV